jgi:hypothetical protein
MTGWEQGSDRGAPRAIWPGMLLILLIATICGAAILAFFG